MPFTRSITTHRPGTAFRASGQMSPFRKLSIGQVVSDRYHAEGSRFFKLLDSLAVGQQALAGMAQEAARRNRGLSPHSFYQAALRGIEQKQSFSQFTPKTLRGRTEGLVLDMLIDPINLLMIGPAAKVWEKGIDGIGHVAMAGARRIGPLSTFIDHVGEKFSVSYMLRRYGFDTIIGTKGEALGKMNEAAAKEMNAYSQKIMKLLPLEEDRRQVFLLMNAGPPSPKMERIIRRTGPFSATAAERETDASVAARAAWQAEYDALSPAKKEAIRLGREWGKKAEEFKIASLLLDEGRAKGLLTKTGMQAYTPMRFSGTKVLEAQREYAQALLANITDLDAAGAIVSKAERANAAKAVKTLQDHLAKYEDMSDFQVMTEAQRGAAGKKLAELQSFQMKRLHRKAIRDLDQKVQDMIETDLARVIENENMAMVRAGAAADFIRNAVGYMMREGLVVPEEFKNLPPQLMKAEMTKLGIKYDARLHSGVQLVRTKAKALRGFLAPKPIADEIERAANFWNQTELATSIWRRATNIYKAWTLGIFPSYHSRNFISNIVNNTYAGMGLRSIEDYRAMMVLNWKLHSGQALDDVGRLGYRGAPALTEAGLVREAYRRRVIDGGQFSEVSHLFPGKSARGILMRIFHPGENPIVRAGFKSGRFIEDHARLSHFAYRLRQGDTLEQAAKSVDKFLFDYHYGLSPFEQKFFRDRMMPFYVWSRFNIPLQLEMLAKQPQKFNRLGKILNGFQDEFGGPEPDEVLMADWLKKQVGVRWRYDPKTKQYMYFCLGSWLPMADILKVAPSRSWKEALDLVTPLLKTPLESFFLNYDLFRGDKIQHFPGETKRLLGWPIDARLDHLVRVFRPLNEADKLLKMTEPPYARTTHQAWTNALVQEFIGRSYPQNYESRRKSVAYVYRRTIGDLKSRKRWFEKTDDAVNAKKVQEQIDKLTKAAKDHLGM